MPEPTVTRFIILAAPRTGSNLLCTLLNSHDDILCHHELFNPAGIFYALELRDTGFSLGTMEERERDPLALLDRAWHAPLGHSHVGFKMTHRQNETVYRNVLSDTEVKKIVLRRANRIKTYVSYLISDKLGQWEVYADADLVKERPRVYVDPAALLEAIATNIEYYAATEGYLRLTNQAFLNVSYETLFEPQEQRRILQFLGVRAEHLGSPVRLQERSVKQNSHELAQLVANFEELEAALRGTSLEKELYAVEY